MKHFLTTALILFVLIIQSCDERITPAQKEIPEVKPPSKIDFLTAKTWQYESLTFQGGSASVKIVSRNPPVGLNTNEATTTFKYNTDGTVVRTAKGKVENAKWRFLKNETQLEVTRSYGAVEVHNIDLLTKDNFNETFIVTKASFNDDAFWLAVITSYGLPNTLTEYSAISKLIPL